MNFCFINLFDYDDRIDLLSPTILDNLRFYYIKKKLNKYLKKVQKAIYNDKCFKIEQILSNLDYKSDTNIWDKFFYISIIGTIAILSTTEGKISNEEYSYHILSFYLKEILKNHSDSNEVLELKLKIIEIAVEMDLLLSELAAKNKTGQFKN